MEAAVEEKLRRGRLLREMLKQDRLAPLPEQALLAWLLAYNEGLLVALDPAGAATILQRLFASVASAGLQLDEPKERWVAVLRDALARTP
jgi:F-type H+-transporting ATPase subunit alpha